MKVNDAFLQFRQIQNLKSQPNSSRDLLKLDSHDLADNMNSSFGQMDMKKPPIRIRPSFAINNSPASKFILNSYDTILNSQIKSISDIGTTLAIPQFSLDILAELCHTAIAAFKSMPLVIHVNSPICVVGDIHGSLHDLIRIFRENGSPFTTQYLFLGDYVDRGQFSIEVITLLFAFFCEGAKIHLIRGNHEFDYICSKYGFLQDVKITYNTNLIYDLFLKAFEFMPLVSIIDHKIFCVHGGISKHLNSIEDLNLIPRPISSPSIAVVHDLVWNDPSKDFPDFVESQRGNCKTFGCQSVQNFFAKTNMKLIIRAHQYVVEGYQENFSRTCLTVFSVSSYSFEGSNKSSILKLNSINDMSFEVYEPLPKLHRMDAQFFSINRKTQEQRKQSMTFRTSCSQAFLNGSPNSRQTKRKISLSHTVDALPSIGFGLKRPPPDLT